jgi:hypothetical protein
MKPRIMLAALALLAVTSCSTPDARPSPPTATTLTTPTKSTLPPLDVAAGAAWTSDGVFDAQLWDGTALVAGHEKFQVIDTATGEVRWEVDSNTDLGDGRKWDANRGMPLLVGDGRDLAVASAYVRTGEDHEYGVALFSAEDGRRLWSDPIGRDGVSLRAADDRIVLVTAVEGGVPADQDDLRMIAFDTRTGDELWERTGTWPKAVVDGTVLGVNAPDEDSASYEVDLDSVVSAFDAETGEPRWDLGSRYRGSEVVLTAGEVVLVHATESAEADAELVLLSVETGEQVAGFGRSEEAFCGTDRDTLIACGVGGGSVSVFRLDDQEVTRLKVQDGFEAVGPDRIFLNGIGDHYYAVDLAGGRIDQRLPGRPQVVTDDYLVVLDDSGEKELAGYPIG